MPFPRLRRRHRQPEIMDQPDLEEDRHFQALRGLERINLLSGSAGLLWSALQTTLPWSDKREFRLLDVATGAGDVPIRLWGRARRQGLRLRIDACDRSPAALCYARQRAAQANADIRFFEHDALQGPLPTGYDVVINSLFLHHLDEEVAVGFLRRLAEAAGHLVLVNDLARSLRGYLMAYVGTRVLSGSDVVHVDGPRSVEGAYNLEEARALAARAGLEGAAVVRRWPCRFLLTWNRP